ncbi:MAG: HNH endonuclease, partial [Bacteroidetes bacterium RIFCSPHIGHO2_02_FULL_44_7]
ITIRELSKGYEDKAEAGVVGYGGKLDIRPPYQREFIYGVKERDAVINTVTNNFPLNVMYWAVRKDGDFEVIDGQQRTISICQYVNGVFSFRQLYFNNLPDNKQAQILNYKLMVYQCTGTDSERLDWFRTINIAGKPLTDQELKNAVYAGSWVSDAKRYFSKTGCVAYQIGQDYLDGLPIRQDYLETAIDWISDGNIEDYMGKHQHDKDAAKLWKYYQDVIDWVAATFTTKRKKIMRGVPWGVLYNQFKNETYDPKAIEAETAKLIADEEEVTSQKGIYPYLLTRDEKYLALRAFPDAIKRRIYEKQKGICPKCPKTKPKRWELEEMEGDHIKPWSKGGKTVEENCQMLCEDHNRRKSGQ